MTPQAVQILGTAATLYGLGGALSVPLQARRMHVRVISGDVSARFFAVYVGGFVIWLLYGLGIGDIPIVAVHAVGLLCGTITLAVALKFHGPATATRLVGQPQRANASGGTTGPAPWRMRRRRPACSGTRHRSLPSKPCDDSQKRTQRRRQRG